MLSMKRVVFPALALLALFITVAGIGLTGGFVNAQSPEPAFTADFPLEDCRFVSYGGNPYFSLKPGYQLLLEGDDDGEEVRVLITVLDAKKVIDLRAEGIGRVRTRVIEEREWIDGELVEVSRNYYARCSQTSDIYYFGEEVDIYEDGEVVRHDGAWKAGDNGALPGIIIPATYLLGSRYFQEIAPGIALDRAEHVAMGLDLNTPAGNFEDCVEVLETTPLEPGSESIKVYCPGIGLSLDNTIEVVDFGFDIDEGDDDEEDEDEDSNS